MRVEEAARLLFWFGTRRWTLGSGRCLGWSYGLLLRRAPFTRFTSLGPPLLLRASVPASHHEPLAHLAALDVPVLALTPSGLSLPALHNWVRTTTPVPFDIYRPTNPVPFILAPLIIGTFLYAAYAARAVLVPVLSSRIVWGVGCTVLSILFTSGYMWNKIKNAPYVQMAPDGRVSWIAGGYSNQLGLESQVVGTLCECRGARRPGGAPHPGVSAVTRLHSLVEALTPDGVLALTVVVLSVFIPAQSSPMKQRIGTYLWLVLMIVLYSLLIRLFKLKNGGYPFGLL